MQPSFVLAEDATNSASGRREIKNEARAKISQASDQRVSDLKQRADKEITRRIEALTKLISRIDKIKKLTGSQKSDLKSKVLAEIDALNLLKAKIDADTDLATLKTDVKSIVSAYRVFLLFMPQIELIGAADRLSNITTNLSVISDKLQARINEAKLSGKDVTELNVLMSDLNSKIAEAKTLSQSVIDEVLPLTPQEYPGNKTIILDARSKIKTGKEDIRLAREDALKIIKQLKIWGKELTPTPTP